MGTLMGRVHALPGSTSSSVAARGSYDSESRAALSFREFERILALEVLGPYHNEIHSALGRTPASVWAEGTAGMELRDPAKPAALLRDFLPFEERIVPREGVRLFNIRYQDGALAHLVDHGAGKLRVKYDPRDLSAVFVELPAGDHVRVPYADMGRLPITLWEHREATQNSVMTISSFVAWLSADGRGLLQSWAATWRRPAGGGLRAALTVAMESVV
jgi:putative transposase